MIGVRIKEERERLGLNQTDFAELAGAKKRTLIDWEKGQTSPNASQLSLLNDAGIDAKYVISGERSVSIKRVAELIELIDSLLEEYNRKVSPSGKARLIAGLLELEQQEPEMVNKNNILPFVTAAGF